MHSFLKSFVLVGSLLSTPIIQGMLPEKEQVQECQPQEQLVSDINRYIIYLYLHTILDYNPSFYKQIDALDKSYLFCAIVSPDSKTILTGSEDYTARLWDVESGQMLKEFKGHTGSVTSIAFSPDGKTILTGSNDKTARLWKVNDCKELKQFIGHSGGINSVAFSPDGKTIFTGSYDHTARLWDVSTGKQVQTFIGHTKLTTDMHSIYEVAFISNKNTMLARSADSKLHAH